MAVIRPEVLIMCAGAGLSIGSSGVGLVGDWVAGALFVALAASTVAVPVLGYAAAGSRLHDRLERLKTWMEDNHGALLAAVLVVIGLMVVHNGIHGLQ